MNADEAKRIALDYVKDKIQYGINVAVELGPDNQRFGIASRLFGSTLRTVWYVEFDIVPPPENPGESVLSCAEIYPVFVNPATGEAKGFSLL